MQTLMTATGQRLALTRKAHGSGWLIIHLRVQDHDRPEQAQRLVELAKGDQRRGVASPQGAGHHPSPSSRTGSQQGGPQGRSSFPPPVPYQAVTSTISNGNGTRPSPAARTDQMPSALQLLRRPDAGAPATAKVEEPTSPQLPELPPPSPAGPPGLLSAGQTAALAAPLNRAHVQTRSQAGRSLNYLEGWFAISEANRIFGFDGWQRETIELRCVAEAQRPIGQDQKPGWGVTYIARVRIRLGSQAKGGATLVREGSGAGHGIDTDLGLAHESALKEAETDAMKRALMTFGNPFGLALYDKQQRQVTSSVRHGRASQHQGSRAQADVGQWVGETGTIRSQVRALGPAEIPAETSAASLVALAPAVVQQLHGAINSLPRLQLETLVSAFRQRFGLTEGAPVAAAITQKQHHDWIEAFLVQVEGREWGNGS